jgi:hypothetical protein
LNEFQFPKIRGAKVTVTVVGAILRAIDDVARRNPDCVVSLTKLGEIAKCNPRQARRAVRVLVELSLVIVEYRNSARGRIASRYRICWPNLAPDETEAQRPPIGSPAAPQASPAAPRGRALKRISNPKPKTNGASLQLEGREEFSIFRPVRLGMIEDTHRLSEWVNWGCAAGDAAFEGLDNPLLSALALAEFAIRKDQRGTPQRFFFHLVGSRQWENPTEVDRRRAVRRYEEFLGNEAVKCVPN